MPDIYAVVTLTNGRVTDNSTVTVEGKTAPLLGRTDDWGFLAPARIKETLTTIGYRTLKILPGSDEAVRVLVERDGTS